jgi:hypothetical protein
VESVCSAVKADILYKAGFYNCGRVFTAQYGLIAYIKQVFIILVESVYSAVRTDCMYKAGFYNHSGKCLQRGKD